MSDEIEIKSGQMFEKNGVQINVHQISDNEVYYQKFDKGINRQLFLENLFRLPLSEFRKGIVGARLLNFQTS